MRLGAGSLPAEASPSAAGAGVTGHLRWFWGQPLLAGAIIAALGLRMFFWVYTQRVWEDALITFTPAANAASGLGLIHHAGDGRVHSFTSVISVLVPVAADFARPGSDLLLMRLVSLLAVLVALCAGYVLTRDLGLAAIPTGFFLAYLALDRWHVFFGMAGMETQIGVAALLVTVVLMVRDRCLLAGVALGLCLLTRPEFILMIAVGLLMLIWRDWRRGLRSAALAAATIAPWVIFATLYYGSPIPQPILAKANAFLSAPPPLSQMGDVAQWFLGRLQIHSGIWQLFAPLREDSFVVGTPVPDDVLAVISAIFITAAIVGAYVLRKELRWMPLWAFPILFIVYRVLALPPGYSEWYLPPFTACAALLAAVGMSRIDLSTWRLGSVEATVLILALVAAVPVWLPLDRRVQLDIENRVRQPLGMYLAGVVCGGDHVATESAGYIGYYSHASLYDFPGLTSSTVLDVLRHAPPDQRTLSYMIARLKPEWLVLRPAETADLQSRYPGVLSAYRPEARFHHEADLTNLGLRLNNTDMDFEVYLRITPAAQTCSSRPTLPSGAGSAGSTRPHTPSAAPS